MKYITSESSIRLIFAATNAGKFRFKKRNSRGEFGRTFSTRIGKFDDRTYLEWQIGYDVPVKEVQQGKKTTSLTNMRFVGSNGKQKHPYELSEILFKSIEIGLVTRSTLENLREEIAGYKAFIDQMHITVENPSCLVLNGLNFEEASVRLPTLFMVETKDDTYIEVSIEKQQYATGVQPMLYFCIPLSAFRNGLDFHGRSSALDDHLEYVIDDGNVQNLLLLMKVFGMASVRHKHDILEVLRLFLECQG